MNDIRTYGIPNATSMDWHLDARAKIVILLFYSVFIFFVDSWWGMFAYLVLAALLVIAMRPQLSILFRLGTFVYVIAALTVLFNSFVWTDEGLSFSIEGLFRGAFFASRILLLVMASLIVCLTTDSMLIASAFRSFLRRLSRFKVPVDDISTILSIALRFIPLTANEFFSIKEAQWARGADFDEGPILARVKSHCAILIPLFVNMFRKADALALSMDSRGYGISTVCRTEISTQRLDIESVSFAVLFCTACVSVSVLG